MALIALLNRSTSLVRSGIGCCRCQDGTQGSCSACLEALVGARALLQFAMGSMEDALQGYGNSVVLCCSVIEGAILGRKSQLSNDSEGQAEEVLPAGDSPGTPLTLRQRQPGVLVQPSPKSETRFSSIIGCDKAKRALMEHVVLPLKLPTAVREVIFIGARAAGNHILMYGAPGTGKTSLANAAASEADATFFQVLPSSVLSKYQGESERALERVFMEAKAAAPSVIFLDEVDALASSRDTSDDLQGRRLLAELLLQMTALQPRDRVTVLGATNRADFVDEALLRRFHSKILVEEPTKAERVQLLGHFLMGVKHSLEQRALEELAGQMAGWTGSDIQSLCKEAAMAPIRELSAKGVLAGFDTAEAAKALIRPVTLGDCKEALQELRVRVHTQGSQNTQEAS
ncbi:unnamed protein product [Chrysoparadoxa australica]